MGLEVVEILSGDPADMHSALQALIECYRTRCLWFLRPDYVPVTVEKKLRVLGYIEKHGDLEAFRLAAPFRKWLSQNFKEASAS